MKSYFTLITIPSLLQAKNLKDRFNSINQSQNNGMRALNIALVGDLEDIDNYGCWCHFAENWTYGRGNPVDEYDMECQKVLRGYECIRMDDVDENGGPSTCVPYELNYDEPLNIDHTFTDEFLISTCTNNNNNGNDAFCKIRSCIVESFFVRNIALLDNSNLQPNPSFRADNGFDFDATCGVHAPGASGKACCGSYPTRFPYQTRGGDIQCCQNKHVYNDVLFNCCQDGTVEISCL